MPGLRNPIGEKQAVAAAGALSCKAGS